MNWLLKNIGVHLWLATLFSVPVVFFVLSFLKPIFPEINPSIAGTVVFASLFAGEGILMHITAKKRVNRLIREGQTWERSGVVQKAEKAYLRAIRVYDTFLLWPFFSRRTAGTICGAIAKFNVTEDKENPNFDLATAIYLKRHPEDEDIALPWLGQLSHKKFVTSLEQEVLTLVAEHHYTSPLFLQMTADLFIGFERKDFTARKLYKYLISSPEFKDRYEKKILPLIGEPDKLLKDEKPFIAAGVKVQRKIQVNDFVVKTAGRLKIFYKKIIARLGSWLSFIALASGKAYAWLKKNPKAQRAVRITFLSIVFLWLAFFMVNTLVHMFKSRTTGKMDKKQIEVQVAKPFTIQVAAYLKKKHADRYVGILKKKGIDASVKKMDGGGKIWFLVRVSQFKDKAGAQKYGRKLKQQKIIDDFFVNNK